MCTGNRADSQSISKCAHGKFSESGVSIGLPRRPRPREGDNQGRNTSYTESTVKVWLLVLLLGAGTVADCCVHSDCCVLS